jgi:hypothetical protein
VVDCAAEVPMIIDTGEKAAPNALLSADRTKSRRDVWCCGVGDGSLDLPTSTV